eukprot:TRINITY_DN12456_c0_g1_i1.p1 TRINITY_DN12456_c0_g1~~TRINITY_DN12456_c0_g1_i1.p1  ORF type:complete len:290 (+),score=34.79 TRINITY_DN12456_c0_g1_i1:73-870(+)
MAWQTVIDATSRVALPDVADYLETRDIAAWQAVNVEAKDAFDTWYEFGNVWQMCAVSQFPQFLADDELYEGENRSRLLSCHALLLRANYVPGCMLILNTIEEASLLECQLRKAFAFCREYHAACSKDAHVLVGNFQMMRCATGTRFEFGVEGMSLIAGLPAGVLKMRMFLDGNKLFTSAEYAEGVGFPFVPHMQAKHTHLTMNVWSANPGFDLRYSEVPLVLDGALRSSTAGQGKNKSILRSTDPVLCVLTLIEANVTQQYSSTT